jgi:transposase
VFRKGENLAATDYQMVRYPDIHQGQCLFTKRLEEGQFIWPAVRDGKVSITRSQLAMLLDKLDWRQPKTSRLNALTML